MSWDCDLAREVQQERKMSFLVDGRSVDVAPLLYGISDRVGVNTNGHAHARAEQPLER